MIPVEVRWEGGWLLSTSDQPFGQLPFSTLGVIVTAPADEPLDAFETYSHHCASAKWDLRIGLRHRSAVAPPLRFCPYCGIRVGLAHRVGESGEAWDCGIVRDLATRWLGRDAHMIRAWIRPDGSANQRMAVARQPLLEWLLDRLMTIAARRCDRHDGRLRQARAEFNAIWHAQQLLSAARGSINGSIASPSVLPTGFIYAVSNGTEIKIGWSGRHPTISGRLEALQTGCAQQLKILGVILGSRRDEKDIHHRFGHHWVRGEWFHDVAEIRLFFRRHNRRTAT